MDYVDALLLHRPDTLVEPEEVAEAFDEWNGQEKFVILASAIKTNANRIAEKICSSTIGS